MILKLVLYIENITNHWVLFIVGIKYADVLSKHYVRREPIDESEVGFTVLASKSGKKGNNRSRSILVVDDDKIILDVLAKGFKFYGLKVFKAENAVDGLNLFLKERTDIVLTDIRMPGDFDGAELARRIRIQFPETIIAVITGGDGEVGRLLLEKGIADHFFTKPCSINHICKTLITDILNL